MKKQTKKVVKKTIKGWAVLGGGKKVIAVAIGEGRPRRFSIGSWVFFTEDQKQEDIVPCTISYSLTKEKR